MFFRISWISAEFNPSRLEVPLHRRLAADAIEQAIRETQ
jgi:hypothetical protein